MSFRTAPLALRVLMPSLLLVTACGLVAACGDASSSGPGPAPVPDAARPRPDAEAASEAGPPTPDALPDAAPAFDLAADLGPDRPLLPDAIGRPDVPPAPDAPPTPDATPPPADTLTDGPLPPDVHVEPDLAPPPPDLGPDAPPPPPPPPTPAPVLRVLPWLGGGLQLEVELPPDVAAPGDWPEMFIDVDGVRLDAAVQPAGITTGYTAILLVPAEDPVEQWVRLVTTQAILDALPAGERVAVMVARDEAEVVAEVSVDRAHAREQLAHLPSEAGRSAAPLMEDVRERLDDLESAYTAPGRAVIVVGESVEEPSPYLLRPVKTLSLGAISDPVADAAALATELLAHRAAVVRLGVCPGLPAETPFVLHVGTWAIDLEAPLPMDHLAGEACDGVAAAADAFPFPTELALTFSPDERILFDQYYAAMSIDPFTTSVTLGLGGPIPAVGHFHGLGTLGCERKSITLEMEGPRRRVAPDLAADRFILISMCQDLRYFGQVFGNRLLADMGLFLSPFKYVRLRIDGVNRGVYMLVYQAERAFRDTSLALSSVVRRGYDIDAWPAEVKYPADPDAAEAARLRFESLGDMALSEPPGSLEAALDARLALDAYLRLLAVFSLLENGDFIDEAFFASSLEGETERYRVMAWDTDDLWSACHAEGARAIVDACGVTYCTEAELDQALLRSTDVYRRYLEALRTVMTLLSPDVLAATMAGVRDELWAVLDDDETAAACTEMVYENPATATAEGARADIAAAMEGALAQTERRREALTAALALCPEAAP